MPDAASIIDHVILSAGLNPLPVLVSAYRLCRVNLDQGAPVPGFTIIYSEGSETGNENEIENVRKALIRKLGDGGNELKWNPCKVEPYDPADVRAKVEDFLRKHDRNKCIVEGPGSYRYHFNYTGGTAAMSVAAYAALVREQSRLKPPYEFDASYLALDRHLLLTDCGRLLTNLTDERKTWDDLTLEQLAALHGYTAKRSERPSDELLALGVRMSNWMCKASKIDSREYGVWERKWDWKNDAESRWTHWPEIPRKGYRPDFPTDSISWFKPRVPGDWQAIVEELPKHFGGHAWKQTGAGLEVNWCEVKTADRLPALYSFVHNGYFELLCYCALRTALQQIDRLETDARLYHSVRTDRGAYTVVEIDVMATLGYDLVAVSCSMTSDPSRVKAKAVEVLHRVRAIGGSGAYTIVLSRLPPSYVAGVESNVTDSLGGREHHVKILSYSTEEQLVEDLRKYLVERVKWPPAAETVES